MQNPAYSKQSINALQWITQILGKYHIPYQIAGGLAARCYGAQRPLADLDIDLPKQLIAKLMPDIEPYIIFGPAQYKDDHWDLFLTTLNYEEQEIDLAALEDCYLTNSETKKRELLAYDLSDSVYVQIGDMTLPLIPKARLIAYKKKLAREVDLVDINGMEN